MALGCEVVDFIGLHFLDNADQVGAVGHIAVVQVQLYIGLVRILVEVVNTVGIEQRTAAFDTVHAVAFLEKELGEVRAVLTGDTCNQGNFHGDGARLK